MSDPYVTSATIVGGNIQLSVMVDEFKPGEWVEISGQATQTNGAFASFYDVQQVPEAANVPADPNVAGDTDHFYVYVTGVPTPHQFKQEADISVMARVARVWLTILGGHYVPPAARATDPGSAYDGMTWKEIKVAALNGGGAWSPPPRG